MSSRFFIDRPIFAWVIALFILVLGTAATTSLPVAQYPTVAPPSIVITMNYPGSLCESASRASWIFSRRASACCSSCGIWSPRRRPYSDSGLWRRFQGVGELI